MTTVWENAVITHIEVAVYVPPESGKIVHTNRPFHGLVFNDAVADKEIIFSDGFVLHTGPNEVHYLPKHSDYRVVSRVTGGCYAINFDLQEEISEKPFSIPFRNHEPILKCFKEAECAWREKHPFQNVNIRKNLYDILLCIQKEQQRNYVPSNKEQLLQPALALIRQQFTQNTLSVRQLAATCGISEAYLRRLFADKFSLSPKEYIIRAKIEYAKRLLRSDQFSVSEIAELCGYAEPCHFSREFTKHVGIAPSCYRQDAKNET